MEIYKYETEEAAEQIILERQSQGLYLTHISNISEGNFLGFSKNNELNQTTPIEERLQSIENTLDLLLLKQEGII